MMMMSLQRYYISILFLIIIMILVSFNVACCSSLQEEKDPLVENYSPSPNNIDDGGSKFIKQTTDNVLRFKRSSDKLGVTSASSLKTLVKVNVNDYGAQGNGNTDDTQAFKKAWQVACSSGGTVLLVVPKMNYLLKPITFSGPCKSSIAVQISGTLLASDKPSDYSEDPTHWLMFHSVRKLSVKGGGTINGNGNIWWQNSCKRNKKQPCKNAPTALTFYKCNNLVVEDLRIKNGQQIHVSFQDSQSVKVSGLTITAPDDSPNTDGIHVTNTQNIQISSSNIGTGDDCISIVSGSRNLKATDITCGPGHGISIGSLGAGNSKDFVSGITVNGAKFVGTTNGVRIKTWQGGSGSASNIKFKNIEMDNVTNPIIIDQNYCDQPDPCEKQKSVVKVRNVMYESIRGTSASEVAVRFDCSDNSPCEGIVLQNIDLKLEGEEAKASCNNVKLSYRGDVSPRCI